MATPPPAPMARSPPRRPRRRPRTTAAAVPAAASACSSCSCCRSGWARRWDSGATEPGRGALRRHGRRRAGPSSGGAQGLAAGRASGAEPGPVDHRPRNARPSVFAEGRAFRGRSPRRGVSARSRALHRPSRLSRHGLTGGGGCQGVLVNRGILLLVPLLLLVAACTRGLEALNSDRFQALTTAVEWVRAGNSRLFTL